MMQSLANTLDKKTLIVARVLKYCAFILVIVGVYNVATRNLSSWLGMQLASNSFLELQVYLYNALFLLGCSYTVWSNRHVRVDVVYSRLSRQAQKRIDIFGYSVFVIPFCVLCLNYCLPWAFRSFKAGEVSGDPGGLPVYPLKAFIPLMLFMVILQSLSELIKLYHEPKT